KIFVLLSHKDISNFHWTRFTAVHRVGRAIVYGRLTVLRVWHGNDVGRGGFIATRIDYLEPDRINPPVTVALSFGPQLHRFAAASNHDVIARVAVAVAVLRFIAAHAGNHNAGNADVVAVVGHARNQICDGDGLVLVIRRPQFDRRLGSNHGWLGVV